MLSGRYYLVQVLASVRRMLPKFSLSAIGPQNGGCPCPQHWLPAQLHIGHGLPSASPREAKIHFTFLYREMAAFRRSPTNILQDSPPSVCAETNADSEPGPVAHREPFVSCMSTSVSRSDFLPLPV